MLDCREDREICEALLKASRKRGESAKTFPDLVVAVGRRFLGAPYATGTLEREGAEALVVNLRAFDCVTFVENVIVLAGLIHTGKTDFADYLASLERIRYRRGRCDGYSSRLHYFTDWLHDNDKKGIIRNVTGEIGGTPFRKAFHCLTDRREDHPALMDPAAFHRMRIIEGICSRRTLSHIVKADLSPVEARIADGDIIAITTEEKGLDVLHTGVAVRVRGQLRLLHASSAAGQVILSEGTLSRYLLARRSRTGIIVGRVIPLEAGGRKPGKRPPAPG